MSEKSRAKHFGKFFVALLLMLVIILLAGGYFWYVMDAPYGEPSSELVPFVVARGMGFYDVSMALEEAGLLADARYIQLRYKIASRLGLASDHRAGRYALSTGRRPSQLIESLTSPTGAERVYTKITVPPGSTSSRIATIVDKAGLAYAKDVRHSIKKVASDYPIVKSEEGLQGYLFPDTYMVETPLLLDETSSIQVAESIVRMMANRFFEILDDIDGTWENYTPSQLHEKIILASIVEREYRVKEEAGLIAAVFNNRLEENMALQSCATVVYVIEETEPGKPFRNDYLRFNRRIFERYLEINSDYNTYYRSDLPPGPIASPGAVALDAAFFPAKSDALFFVVKDPREGTHVFTRYYADHLTARAAYLNQFVVKD